MTKLEKLKSDILFATKSRNELASSLLKVVLGECQSKDKYDDDFIVSYCRKMIQSNSETMALGGDSVKLSRENELLREYVPKELSLEELQIHADRLAIEIVDAKSDGQAMGVLSKYLKSIGTSAGGETLKVVIGKLRQKVTV
jgi:uncharacterized protein YqeY